MANTVIGIGAELWIENGSGTLTKVAEMISLTLPNPQVAEVEATNFDSPDRSREYIAGLKDNGTVTYGINWDAGSATDTLIAEAQSSYEVRDIQVKIPTVSGTKQVFSFSGLITGFEKTTPIDDRQTATITIRVSGAVTQEADA